MTASLLSTEDFKEQLNAIEEARLADHQFGVSALAHEMEMSRSKLHRKVREAFHESASQYISHKRLKMARQILLDRKTSVTKTATLCGFRSVTYFDKCFHDYYGYPPGDTEKHRLGLKKPVQKEKYNYLKKWFKRFK